MMMIRMINNNKKRELVLYKATNRKLIRDIMLQLNIYLMKKKK